MFKSSRRLLSLNFLSRLFLLISSTLTASAEPAPPPKAYVMDTDKNLVHSVSLHDGTILTSPKLDRIPNFLILSPDGSRLLVFERSHLRGLTDRRWRTLATSRPTEPTPLSIFNTTTMQLVARIDTFGWNASPNALDFWPISEVNALWDTSGTLITVLCWGKHNQLPELVQVDIRQGNVTARLALNCKTDEFTHLVSVTPGKTAVLLYEDKNAQNKQHPAHKCLLIDLANLPRSKEISLAGTLSDLPITYEGEYVYVMAGGSLDDKDNPDAHLHVISATKQALMTSIDGGLAFTDAAFDADSGLTLIARIGHLNNKSNLLALKEGREIANLELPDKPLRCVLAPITRRLYVLCYDSIQIIDLQSLKIVGSIATPHRTRGFWEAGAFNRPPSTLIFDKEESTGVLGFSGDDEFVVCDLMKCAVRTKIDVQSGWGAFLASAASLQIAFIDRAFNAAARESNVFYTGITANRPLHSNMLLDPAKRRLYILDEQSIDVVDVQSASKLATISMNFSPKYIYYSPQPTSSLLLVLGVRKGMTNSYSYRFGAIDMKNNDRALEQEWRGDCLFSADGKYAVNYDSNNVYLLDASSLETIKRISGFKELRQLVLGY